MSSNSLGVLAVIPARGGSKGIPRKNLAEFRGKPLLEHTFDAVRGSQAIDLAVVTTDDTEILDFSVLHAFKTLRRRDELSNDSASLIDVLLDVLDRLVTLGLGVDPDYVILLQPTSPLRTSSDIDDFVAAIRSHGYRSAVSVHEVREHSMECVYIDPTGNWEYVVDPPDSSFGRQCYRDDEYFINGAMYAATPDWIRKHRAFLVKGQEIGFIRMPASRGLDIDIHDDLDRLM